MSSACAVTLLREVHVIHHGIAHDFVAMFGQPGPDVFDPSSLLLTSFNIFALPEWLSAPRPGVQEYTGGRPHF